jgi:hypothetical protein
MSNENHGFSTLVRFGLSRSFKTPYGLFYLAMGIFLPVMIMSLLIFVGSTSTSHHIAKIQGATIGINNPVVYQIFSTIPTILPIFTIIGSVGSTYLFSSDRSNGVYEYLIATRRVRIKDIFISNIVTVVIGVSIILGLDLLIIFSVVSRTDSGILVDMFKLIALESIPLSYLGALLSMLAILIWASLSKTYVGINSPGGIGIFVGFAPVLLLTILVNTGTVAAKDLYLFGGLYSLALFAIFVAFLILVSQKISNESMLT